MESKNQLSQSSKVVHNLPIWINNTITSNQSIIFISKKPDTVKNIKLYLENKGIDPLIIKNCGSFNKEYDYTLNDNSLIVVKSSDENKILLANCLPYDINRLSRPDYKTQHLSYHTLIPIELRNDVENVEKQIKKYLNNLINVFAKGMLSFKINTIVDRLSGESTGHINILFEPLNGLELNQLWMKLSLLKIFLNGTPIEELNKKDKYYFLNWQWSKKRIYKKK